MIIRDKLACQVASLYNTYMEQLLDKILTVLVGFFPEDYLLPIRFFLAKTVLFSFLGGLLFSYPLNFLFKKFGHSLQAWWKEKKRERRLAQLNVPNGEFIGEVTHYLSKLKVAIIKIRHKHLAQGETILIKGSQTKLMVPVRSMQIEHQTVEVAKKGSEIGLLTGKPVCKNDLVFKLKR